VLAGSVEVVSRAISLQSSLRKDIPRDDKIMTGLESVNLMLPRCSAAARLCPECKCVGWQRGGRKVRQAHQNVGPVDNGTPFRRVGLHTMIYDESDHALSRQSRGSNRLQLTRASARETSPTLLTGMPHSQHIGHGSQSGSDGQWPTRTPLPTCAAYVTRIITDTWRWALRSGSLSTNASVTIILRQSLPHMCKVMRT
jgi:hypothetical protein